MCVAYCASGFVSSFLGKIARTATPGSPRSSAISVMPQCVTGSSPMDAAACRMQYPQRRGNQAPATASVLDLCHASSLDDPRYWQFRAEEVRTLAEQMIDAGAKDIML